MMRKLFLPLMLMVTLLAGCLGIEEEIAIPKATLQNMTDRKFPIRKELSIRKKPVPADIELFSPEVFFQDDSIGLTVQYTASIFMGRIGGSVTFKCRPLYKPENTSFYLSDFVMTQITMSDLTISEKDRVMVLISSIAKDVLEDYPLYALNQKDYRQNLAHLVLKKVFVRDDELVLLITL